MCILDINFVCLTHSWGGCSSRARRPVGFFCKEMGSGRASLRWPRVRAAGSRVSLAGCALSARGRTWWWPWAGVIWGEAQVIFIPGCRGQQDSNKGSLRSGDPVSPQAPSAAVRQWESLGARQIGPVHRVRVSEAMSPGCIAGWGVPCGLRAHSEAISAQPPKEGARDSSPVPGLCPSCVGCWVFTLQDLE